MMIQSNDATKFSQMTQQKLAKCHNGAYGLVEIKLSGDDAIEQGARTLKSLAEKIDTTRMPEPSFKMVLTATGDYAYRREDGVLVVPVGCLKD